MRVNAALQEFMFDLAGNKAMPGALKKRDKKADKDKKLKIKLHGKVDSKTNSLQQKSEKA